MPNHTHKPSKTHAEPRNHQNSSPLPPISHQIHNLSRCLSFIPKSNQPPNPQEVGPPGPWPKLLTKTQSPPTTQNSLQRNHNNNAYKTTKNPQKQPTHHINWSNPWNPPPKPSKPTKSPPKVSIPFELHKAKLPSKLPHHNLYLPFHWCQVVAVSWWNSLKKEAREGDQNGRRREIWSGSWKWRKEEKGKVEYKHNKWRSYKIMREIIFLMLQS